MPISATGQDVAGSQVPGRQLAFVWFARVIRVEAEFRPFHAGEILDLHFHLDHGPPLPLRADRDDSGPITVQPHRADILALILRVFGYARQEYLAADHPLDVVRVGGRQLKLVVGDV